MSAISHLVSSTSVKTVDLDFIVVACRSPNYDYVCIIIVIITTIIIYNLWHIKLIQFFFSFVTFQEIFSFVPKVR